MNTLRNAKEIALLVANAWEERSTDGLRDVLDADFEYASQWVFDTMRGADAYVDYLTGKFNAIKRSNCNINVKDTRYSDTLIEIDLEQSMPDIVKVVMLQLKISNGKITRGDMCAPAFRQLP